MMMTNRRRFVRPYMGVFIALGAAVCIYSVLNLAVERLDLRFALLAVFTVLISSRLCVPIPRTTGEISVSDVFIYLTIMLYDGEAAVLLAALELFSASRFVKNPKSVFTSLFNAGMMACSTFVTVSVLRLIFGNITELPHGQFSARFVAALCVMGFVQYVTNSTIAAVHTAFKADAPVWSTWRRVYLWTSITYFAGASGAGIIAKLTDAAGLYAIIATLPIIAIVYFTYRTYLENIAAMATATEAAKAEAEAAKAKAAAEAKAEAEAAKAEAQGAKAKAAAEQAEQAKLHVEELNHYIAEQERIREQYAQIEKLSALGELASGVAHDFNNTLAGILGRAQLLLATKDPEKIEAGLKIIIKTAKDGAKTIRRIQDFARQRRDHDFQPVSMDQLLLDVREITRPRWKNRAEADGVQINLELQLRSDNALVMGDESELREVLVNLVFNAVDAMPSGGTLTLSAVESRGMVEICAADTGAGMSEEVRTRIFDPFFTTKGKTGMGLGLAVSYGIVRRHEGTIEVQSEVGRGTCLRIRLPIAKGAVMSKPTGELPVLAAAPKKTSPVRILVVEDEGHMRELLKDILEREGCRVTLAREGHEALSLFDESEFDAIFTDLGMPGMSGWEFARSVRERDKRIPLVVVTGWGEAVGSNEQSAAQVDWVVAKPFDNRQIIDIVREISHRREEFGRPGEVVGDAEFAASLIN
jgi:signal transduction histidine kinase/CheY-like chemotaxis protein